MVALRSAGSQLAVFHSELVLKGSDEGDGGRDGGRDVSPDELPVVCGG